MLLRGKVRRFTLALTVLTLGLSAHAADDKSDKSKSKDKDRAVGTPVLWREPADITSLNLLLGPGGEEMKPDVSKVTFIKEEKGGWSKKYRVVDGGGHEWVAKIGVEAQPETAATRLLWAAGYTTDINYLVPSVTIEGLGTFKNVRFEARPKHIKRLGEWQWDHNPFVGTMELQGLKVMMVLIGNWDIKDSNNKILRVHNEQTGEDELRYMVSDLGATIGKTGGLITRSRNQPADFAEAKFVDVLKNNRIDFHYSGKRKDMVRDITIGQARWIGQLLSRLSDEQISDAFRAANYSPQDVAMLAQTVRGRIIELAALPQSQTAGGSAIQR
ncbi:MAG: hypothetical protein AABO57_06290 [Acidobacteriota bacterium]